MAEVARNIYLAMNDLGAKVKLIELPGWSHLKAEIHPEIRDRIEAGLSRNDLQQPAAIHSYPPDPFKGTMNVDGAAIQVTNTVFETDKCPLLWRDMLNSPQFVENWVPCNFQREAYSSQGVNNDKLRVISYGVDPIRYNPNVEPMNIDNVDGKFTIMTAMDWGLRKNPEAIVSAFLQEFNGVEDACLVIKAYTGYGIDDGSKNMIRHKITTLRQMTRSTANVYLITDFLHSDRMASFHKAADVWINLSRGEGWDMGSLQSMACGVPVIMSDNTSHKVYGNNDNGYMVPCKKVAVNDREFLAKNPQFLDHSWYEANIKDAKVAMRQAYNDHKSGKLLEKGKVARQTACDFTWRKAAANMLYHLGKYYK